ncbi:MAG TPA: hypothetical protein VJB57_10080 [Dehalococcoidia bacterium]|nr:hypothetical protein [Dehalococcoidia bacterium]
MLKRRPDPWRELGIPVIAAVIAAGTFWWFGLLDNNGLLGAVIATVAFAAAWLMVEIACNLRLFINGRAPKGSPRTLYGLDLRKARLALEQNVPSEMFTVWVGISTLEVNNFADEIEELLKASGWAWGGGRAFSIGGEDYADILFELPEGKRNGGIEALHKVLISSGYKSSIESSGGTALTACVGEATH